MEVRRYVTMLFSLWWLRLLWAERRPDSPPWGTGQQLLGDFSISGFFPLHKNHVSVSSLPAMEACDVGDYNKLGYHLIQAMRFAVEEINNGTGSQPLLPGVKLGYQIYDICSVQASILATLQVLSQEYQRVSTAGTEEDRNLSSAPDPGQKVVAVIGPDSSGKSFTTAVLLGAYLVPQISYQASNKMLSNKFLYPSFFRTIPSDKYQVAAMIQLLVRFKWTWIALLGSDNEYGRQGIHSLSQQAAQHDICIAYQAVIPKLTADTAQVMRTMVTNILRTKVNTIVLFSSKSKLRDFLLFVIEQNVSGKVWIGTEDWSAASLVSGIPGVHTIGTVLGISMKYTTISGLEEFERKSVDSSRPHSSTQEILFGTRHQSIDCLQNIDLCHFGRQNCSLEKYDVASFSVYKAVYAVAHALHRALGCDTRECRKRSVHPQQLVPWLKQVRFNLGNTSMYFDKNGDPPTEYDIVTWIWRGANWSPRVVGSFTTDPTVLEIEAAQIKWSSGSVPLSICSPECPAGHRKVQTGQHKCCFDCLPCPAATFLNKSASTTCQPCHPDKWAPPLSEQCLNRTVLLLAWDAPLSIALLILLALSLIMTSGSALILLLNLNTPVAKSAGGRTCLLMLAALTAASGSSLCHFGIPSNVACILKQPLFVFSFSVCLACIAVRAFQIVCIFKLASKLPPAYDTWTTNHGPEFTILLLSATILFISVLCMVLEPSYPSQDLEFYTNTIVLECSNTLSPGTRLQLIYVSLLSILCFVFSYMGKDLPANYNEAKCISFSLMVYMISWISFFTIYLSNRGPVTMAAHVFAIQASVWGILLGYFFPKLYIILLRPQMNTTAHFQNCIQMYTMNKE